MAIVNHNKSIPDPEDDIEPHEIHLDFIQEDINNSRETRVHVYDPIEEEIEKKEGEGDEIKTSEDSNQNGGK